MPLFRRGGASSRAPGSLVARLEVGIATHLGRVREENEDHFLVLLPEDEETLSQRGALLAVSDGMGGHAAGSLASQISIESLQRAYFGPLLGRGVEEALREGYVAANRCVMAAGEADARRSGMGATLVAVAIHAGSLWTANVGDSRAYLMRQGRLERLTRDHSVAQELADSGQLDDPDNAGALSHQLTRCIGYDEVGWEPDVRRCELAAGDLVLLASDGLTGYVDDPAIAEALRLGLSPSASAHVLVERALVAGGHDNITVLLARVARLD